MKYHKTRMSSLNYCKYCDKYFHFKDLYDQHVITCEYFHRSRRQRERQEDAIETLPSAQEQFKLIQHLALKIHHLENEVHKLKINTGVRKRRLILDILNHHGSPKPPTLFRDWYKSMLVTTEHLEALFDHDLIDGIKSLLAVYLRQKDCVIPIVSFHQKMNTVYIYDHFEEDDDEPRWILMEHPVFQQWINHLNHLFLQCFLKWQLEHAHVIRADENEKEKNIANMHKINGLGERYESKRRQQLRKWVYETVAKDIHLLEDIYV
jgi:hypothetical protein